MTTLTIQLSPENVRNLSLLSQGGGCSSDELVNAALAQYAMQEAFIMQRVQKGLDQIAQGHGISHEQALEHFAARFAQSDTQ